MIRKQIEYWCARWFMGYGIKISFPRPPQWRHRSPGCFEGNTAPPTLPQRNWVRPSVHTNLSRKRSFRKRSSNRMNLKIPELRFRVDGNHFENGDLRWSCDFPDRVFLKHKYKMAGDRCVMYTVNLSNITGAEQTASDCLWGRAYIFKVIFAVKNKQLSTARWNFYFKICF